MSERALRRKVVSMLEPLDGFAVENPAHPGTPDVNFIGGWIELKIAEAWPPQGGPLRIPHFTQQQRVCLRKRWLKGGRAVVLLRVKREWLLFDGETAAKHLGLVGRDDLLSLAKKHWLQKPQSYEFRKCLLAVEPSKKR